MTTEPTALQLMIAHLATNPCLPTQLRVLHDLALYDSGDALLGREEKEALSAVIQFSELLQQVPLDQLQQLL